MNNFIVRTLGAAAAVIVATACHSDEPEVLPADYQEIEINTTDAGSMSGIYVLNEGNMGANKATIDFVDFRRSMYIRNLYPERNPSVVLELGDTGSDIRINGSRLYAVVNGSHKVEVMDAASAVRIGQVDIDSPRAIVFDSTHAYVSSYVGGDGDCGSVVRFDLSTLKVDGKVSVGLSPEDMAIVDGKLYVANSAHFSGMDATYDNTVSVIDLADFSRTDAIEVAVNMHHLATDASGNIWVSSRGNYYDIPSRLFKLSRDAAGKYAVAATLDIPCTNFTIAGNRLYYYATVYDANWNAVQSFGTVDTLTATEAGPFITDGTESAIVTPYAIAVHPDNGDIYVTDAKNYVSSGALHCYSAAGKLKWSATTGDVPGHLVFLKK